MSPLRAAPWSPLATALAARTDRLRIGDPVENAYRDAPWPETEPAAAYAVYVTDERRRYRTILLDLDSDGTADSRRAVCRDAAQVRRLLDAAGLGAVETLSGPSGGRHLLLTLTGAGLRPGDVADLARRLADLAPSLDTSPLLNPSTGCVRPPGSPHRDGGRSEIVGDPAVALGLLEEGNAPADVLRLSRALAATGRTLRAAPSTTGVSQAVRELEEPGEVPMRYASGSEAVAALAVSYANRSASADEFVAFVMGNAASVAGAVFTRRCREDGEEAAERWVRRTYASAESFVRANPTRRPPGSLEPGQGAQVAAAVRAAIPKAGLRPRERRALLAVCHLAESTGRDVLALGLRDHAEAAGLSRTTTQRARVGLRAAGALELVAVAEGEAAGVWRLRDPVSWRDPIWASPSPGVDNLGPQAPKEGGVRPCVPRLSTPLTISMQALATDVSHDLWRARGLAETPRRTYELLTADLAAAGDGLTVREVTAALGSCERTARRALAALASVGMARRDDRFRWSAEARDGAEVAEEVGSAGTGDRQHAQHEHERRCWRVTQAVSRLRRWLSETSTQDRAVPADVDPVTGEIAVPPDGATSPSHGPRQARAPGENPPPPEAVVA